MRVNRSQIVNGLTDYIRSDITPKMDKAMQIILSVGVNSALANNRIMDSVFDNTIVSSLLEDDGSGTYEITGVLDAMKRRSTSTGVSPSQSRRSRSCPRVRSLSTSTRAM